MLNSSISASQTDFGVQNSSFNQGSSLDLMSKAGSTDSESVNQFNDSWNRYSSLEKLDNNVFFYNANKLNFASIDFGNIGDAVLSMAKKSRERFEASYEEVTSSLELSDGQLSMEDLLQKQMSSFVTTMDIEMITKVVSKSVENIYILLRQ